MVEFGGGTHGSHRQAENDERLVFMLQLAESYLTSPLYRQILEAPKGRRNEGRRVGEAGRVDQRERGSVGLVIDP